MRHLGEEDGGRLCGHRLLAVSVGFVGRFHLGLGRQEGLEPDGIGDGVPGRGRREVFPQWRGLIVRTGCAHERRVGSGRALHVRWEEASRDLQANGLL